MTRALNAKCKLFLILTSNKLILRLESIYSVLNKKINSCRNLNFTNQLTYKKDRLEFTQIATKTQLLLRLRDNSEGFWDLLFYSRVQEPLICILLQ